MAVEKDALSYLSTKQSAASNEIVAREWADFEDLYNRRLWHQLTLKLVDFVRVTEKREENNLIELYNSFLQTFENKINPLSLVEIASFIVPQFTDKHEAVQFLKKMEEKVASSIEAVCLCKVLAAQILLDKLNDESAAKKLIEEIEKSLEEMDGITSVHGRYYLVASQLYRNQGKHADYYRTALRYLGCIDFSDVSKSELKQHAFFLGLAALLGDGVYNLGELLAHPVLEELEGTDEAWIVKLLCIFNRGDIAAFKKMKPQWSSIPDLVAHEVKLRQKISLLCLIELTFKHPSRQLTFEEIAKETCLPINEVELLVMKALAQGLVKGAIDQVSNVVHITWVQPRVLDKTQISSMVNRLDTWGKDVVSMESLIETRGSDFLTL